MPKIEKLTIYQILKNLTIMLQNDNINILIIKYEKYERI